MRHIIAAGGAAPQHSLACAELLSRTVEQLGAAGRGSAPQCLQAGDAQPKFDALATSFGALSAALAWGCVAIAGLAIVVAIAGFAWGRAIVREAKEDARDEAKRIIDKWLLDEAPRIMRDAVGPLSMSQESPRLPFEGDPADDIGREAG